MRTRPGLGVSQTADEDLMSEATASATEPKSKPGTKKASAKTSASKAAPLDIKTSVEVASGIITELTKTNFEESVETAKAVMKSTDLKSAIELQQELIKATFKRNMEAAKEINELTVSSFKEAFAPMTEKFTEAFNKLRAA